MTVAVEFVSIWSGREHVANAQLDLISGKLTDVQQNDELLAARGTDELDEEFVRYEGEEYDIEYSEELGAHFVSDDALGEIQALVSG